MAPLKKFAQVVGKRVCGETNVHQFCVFALATKNAGKNFCPKASQLPQKKKDPQLLEAFARNVNFKNN